MRKMLFDGLTWFAAGQQGDHSKAQCPLAKCSLYVHAAPMLADLQPGQVLARGVSRHLADLGFACIEEFVPARGLRVDVMALGPKGELWVVECKSGLPDFRSDAKWEGYLDYCDRFFWAVDAAFPVEVLPEGTGLIIADAYDAEVLRMGPEAKLAGARRKALTLKYGRDAARRLKGYQDPQGLRNGG